MGRRRGRADGGPAEGIHTGQLPPYGGVLACRGLRAGAGQHQLACWRGFEYGLEEGRPPSKEGAALDEQVRHTPQAYSIEVE